VSGSVSFDRAVEYYDRTRGISPDAQARQTEVLVEELRWRGPTADFSELAARLGDARLLTRVLSQG